MPILKCVCVCVCVWGGGGVAVICYYLHILFFFALSNNGELVNGHAVFSINLYQDCNFI